MRVIAGKARGTRLVSPCGMNTRPTADRVKEALFSIITSRFEPEEARVLDICAGAGSLGIEALSRGASSCCFIEHDKNAVAAVKKNLGAARCSGQAEILEMDMERALRLLASRQASFDIIFFDPPYRSEFYATVPGTVSRLALLAPDGLFIAETSVKNILPDHFDALVKFDRRCYGDTALEFYTCGG